MLLLSCVLVFFTDTAENKKYSKLKAHLKYFIVFCINIWYVLKIKEYIGENLSVY